MTLRAQMQAAVKDIKTEVGQRAAAIRVLAAAGHTQPPKVTVGRMQGSTLRVYAWDVDGGLLLATGPNFVPTIYAASDIQQPQPGVYMLAAEDSRREAQVARQAQRFIGTPPSLTAAIRRALPRDRVAAGKAASKVRVASRRAATATSTHVRSLEAAERAELASALQAFLGASA